MKSTAENRGSRFEMYMDTHPAAAMNGIILQRTISASLHPVSTGITVGSIIADRHKAATNTPIFLYVTELICLNKRSILSLVS